MLHTPKRENNLQIWSEDRSLRTAMVLTLLIGCVNSEMRFYLR